MEFVEKPAVVVAIQWDGTLSGSQDIGRFVERKSVKFEANVDGGGCATKLRITGRDETLELWKTDWLVKRGNELHVFGDAAFKSLYSPKED